jgi:uncharacterized protein YigE (DUF2233 family)
MRRYRFFSVACLSGLLVLGLNSFTGRQTSLDDKILSYVASLKSQDLKFYWRDDKGVILKSIQNLKTWLDSKQKTLVFATNGGIFMEDYTPLGLFIQEQKTLRPLNTSTGFGNFYLKPNGVFYITTNSTAVVCKTTDFINNGKIRFATQSGPMLVIDGDINQVFKQGSNNLNIRNGVGILSEGKIVFGMSKEPISFYDFASFFKSQGCKNALYLDGFVSQTYLPEKSWIQTDGNFGVIIGVTTEKK